MFVHTYFSTLCAYPIKIRYECVASDSYLKVYCICLCLPLSFHAELYTLERKLIF